MTRSFSLPGVLPLLALCVVFMAGTATAAPGRSASSSTSTSITIVLSGPSPYYGEAADTLEEELQRSGHSARRIGLGELMEQWGATPIGDRDLFVAIGTAAASWLGQNAPPSVPIVYCLVTGLTDSGLEERPWTAGVRAEIAVADQFRLIQEVLPEAHRIGMLYRGDESRGDESRTSNGGKRADLPSVVEAALPEGWTLHAVDVNRQPAFAKALDVLMEQPIDVLWTTPDRGVMTKENVLHLLLTSIKLGKPVFGYSRPCVRSGALIGVGISPETQARQAARLLETMLETPPDEPPPARHIDPDFEISVNFEVARQLSVTFPETLATRVDHRFGE